MALTTIGTVFASSLPGNDFNMTRAENVDKKADDKESKIKEKKSFIESRKSVCATFSVQFQCIYKIILQLHKKLKKLRKYRKNFSLD